MGYELMKAITRMIDAAAIAAAVVFFVAGCGGERPDPPPKQAAGKTAVSADKAAIPANRVAALEKEVARLRNEVQQLRQRIEVDAKMMHQRNGMPPYRHQPGVGGPDGFREGEFRPRHFTRRNGGAEMRGNPTAERKDPAEMTPEERRAWHEERRKMREERRQKMLEERNRMKISDQGKQTTNNRKEESK